MEKKYLTNEMLSRYYKKDRSMFGYGVKHRAIAKSIEGCKTSFYDYYAEHGTLRKLDSTGNLKGISLETLSLLEKLIEEKIGKTKDEEPKPIKDISARFRVRPGPHPIK